MTKYFAALVMFLVAWPSFAADSNGYSAKYEVRAGNTTDSATNFDLVTGVAQACDQTITTTTSPTGNWSAINWSNTVICIQVGDHTGRGSFSIDGAGTSGTRKIIKGVKTDGTLADKPWSVSSANRVKIRKLNCTGQDYIVTTRLWVTTTSSDNPKVQWSGCDYMVNHELLVDPELDASPDGSSALVRMRDSSGDESNFLTLQNSVIRNSGKKAGSDLHCINLDSADVRIVNNEIYNCGGDGIVADNGSNPYRAVIENNDIYQTSTYLIGCDGSPGTTCNCGEDGIDIKDNSTSSSDSIQIIHNRITGWRTTYNACGGSNSGGYGINTGGTSAAYYLLAQNNIIWSTAHGINFNSSGRDEQDSVIGNILYDITHQNAPSTICPGASSDMCSEKSYALIPYSGNSNEWYLNTVIASEIGMWWSGGSNNDVRCNVFIDVPDTRSGTPGSGTIVNRNVFYGGETYTVGESPSNNSVSILTRANSTTYNLGTVVRTASLNGFLYKATNTGTSGSSSPTWCTALGCTVEDNGVTWQAIRGPYSFYQKLKTSPVQYTIPYARVHSSAPEFAFCPSGYASRTGIGIDNQN